MRKKNLCVLTFGIVSAVILTACGSNVSEQGAEAAQGYSINTTSAGGTDGSGSEYEISDMLPRPSDDTFIMSVEEAMKFTGKNPERTNIEDGSPDTDSGNTQGNGTLVAYFSRAENIDFDINVDAVTSASINLDEENNPVGNIRLMAEYISEETGAEIFSIRTMEVYPAAYWDTTDQAAAEKSENARPELSAHVQNMEDYNTIYLGYPNWWGTLPMAVASFLEEYDFTGKTIIPFASYGGSESGSGVSMIKELCPDAVVLDGLAIKGSEVDTDKAKQTVAEFITGLISRY